MATLKTWKMKNRNLVYSGGQFVWIYDNDAVRQRLENRLRYWLNEARNVSIKALEDQGKNVTGDPAGIDYLDIFNSSVGNEYIEDIFKNQLLIDEFVKRVDSLSVNIRRDTRTLSVQFRVISTIDGAEIEGGI